jgi:hypothetical protein
MTPCAVKAAATAVVASAATFAGVTLATPATPAATPYVCPTQGVTGNPITPQQCLFLTSLNDNNVPINTFTLSGTRTLCSNINDEGATAAADTLYNAWLGQPYQITQGDAVYYVQYVSADGVCKSYGYDFP